MADRDTVREARKAFISTRIRLLRTKEFRMIGSMTMQLKPVCTSRVKTGATDGTHLFYNPEYFLSLTKGQRCTLLAHETLHPAYRHHTRRGQRNFERWNHATDHRINNDLVAMGFEPLPRWVCDPQYADMESERIYPFMDEMDDESGGGQDGDDGGAQSDAAQGSSPGTGDNSSTSDDASGARSERAGGSSGRDVSGEEDDPGDLPSHADMDVGGCGVCLDAPVKSEAERSDEEQKWARRFEQAAQVAKAQGCLPVSMQRVLGEMHKPRTPWRAHLRKFMQKHTTMVDFTYRPLSRRYLPLDIYVPSVKKEDAPTFVFLRDVSGSISGREYDLATAHAFKIARELRPEKMYLVDCDAKIQKITVVRRGSTRDIVGTTGGGGTDFSPVFDWIKEERINPRFFIGFTDLYASLPSVPPPYPVLWATWGHHKAAPWGKVVEIDVEAL